ncbi:hypothetical protein NW768_011489 [Fusarium equiseti]|uniref:Uncharacterized protein n=1 Tax=Fusarium equiseti TaxID=61235 RepID=A0ABQ8QX60_FUSEQ|nr:hypothetical protein NW768_011489 [Fusarium equiseti]
MDISLSVKKDKNKGKAKKNKEKKGKKEKKERKTQTVSIDLTSPARAQTPPPGPGPDAAPTAAHTPTRAPSQQNGKRRGRSTTRREQAQHASDPRNNEHTYNSKPLPLFSSNDSIGPPSTGTNAVRPRAKSAAAVPDRPRTNDIERSSYNHDCKIKTLETCLSLKDRYLTMPPAVHTDQEPFWTRVRDSLERRSVTRGKFKDLQAVQRAVESWCQPRRSSMREERLPAVSQSHPELDELVDQWNIVFAQRFCKIHMGYFSSAIWPQFAEEKVTEMVRRNLNARITNILTKRREALQRSNPSALLPTNSSLEDYDNALKAMNSQPTATLTDEDQVRKSEAVMSVVLELQPGLSAALSQFLSGPNAPTRRSEPSSGQQKGETAASRERVNSTIPPSWTAPPALQRPPSSVGPTTQLPPPSFALPARPPPSAILNDPTFSRGSRSTKPLEKSGEESSRKRKDLDLPTRSSPADTRARTSSRDSGASFKENSNPKASSHDQAKRPRYESHFSDLPPASNLVLGGRDNYGARTPSSQRPRPRSPPRPKTSYGPIETQGHKIPPMTPCSTKTRPTTGPRTDVPSHPADSYQTPENSQSTTRHNGQRRGDRQAPGDYYRPDSMSRRRSNW